MVATTSQIIGKVNPGLYSKNWKDLLKKYKSPDKIPLEEIEQKPDAEHTLVYESSSETLEPVYFFIIDLMNEMGLAPEKLIDNFTSSPGSGYFAEMGQRAGIMQQQGTNLLQTIGVLIKSVLQIIYDLKEFRIRLQTYDDLKSDKKETKEGARLSLKQLWMDKVDMMKGNSSIKAMGMGQAGFQTLIDAFLVANTEKEAKELDLNDRVKRIIISRIQEFNVWVDQSERELRKRYEIEKTYLKSQVSSLKLQSRWAKPYLKAASELQMKSGGREPALVKVFSTLILELSILGKSKIKIEEAALEGKVPLDLKNMKMKRNYYSCIVVDFKFRGIPQKAGQNYVFGGRAEISFKAYTLNDDELKKIDKELENSDINDALKLVEGTTTESIDQLQEDINFFLEEKTEEEKKKESSGFNPFTALFGKYNEPEKKESKEKKKEEKEKPIKSDDWIEKNHIRTLAAERAKETAFALFDVYKKAHQMPSFT